MSKCWKCEKAGRGCGWINGRKLPKGAREENGIVVQCMGYKKIRSSGIARRVSTDEEEPNTMTKAVALFYGVARESVYRWKKRDPERYKDAIKTVERYWGSYAK